MSDASEVKRWLTTLPRAGTGVEAWQDDNCGFIEVVSSVDHDRIMSERDELWKRATKFVMPGEMDTGESIEHYIKTLEQTIAELRAEVEKLRHDCGNHNISQADIDWCVLCDRKSNEATIATQARVIEELKASIGLAVSKLEEYHETYLDYDRPEMTAVPMEDDLLGIKHHLEGTLISDEELAAVEKEEET